MGVKIKQTPTYRKNLDRGCPDDATPCIVCGKPVKDATAMYWIRMSVYGDAITDAEADADPEFDQGCFPVGSDCWRKRPELHDVGTEVMR